VSIDRLNYAASLLLLQQRDWQVGTFLDIGAAEGAFVLVRRRFNLFPKAPHFFVDAMEENRPLYDALRQRPNAPFGIAGYEIAALSAIEGETTIRVDPQFYNTHIEGVQARSAYGEARRVPVRLLDSVCDAHELPEPYALKLDVQGGELDVLRGATRTLEKSTVVVVEVQTNSARCTLADMLSFMQSRGFVVFDVTDLAHAPSDQTFYQCYVTFIPKQLDFRGKQPWIAPEQEQRMVDGLKARRAMIIESLIGASVPGTGAQDAT
jgi:FkbM family methyltransferase